VSIYLSKGEYAYYRVAEAAAAYFTARLLFAHHEYAYVGIGLGVFIAYESVKALMQWKSERESYQRLMRQLDNIPVDGVQSQQEREK